MLALHAICQFMETDPDCDFFGAVCILSPRVQAALRYTFLKPVVCQVYLEVFG